MTPLERLHAAQHDDLVLPSDSALTAYLAELDPATALRDLEPVTAIERRHLATIRGAA